jgi:hypothetical protein
MMFKSALGGMTALMLGMGAIAPTILLLTAPQAILAATVRGQGTFKLQGRLPTGITSVNYSRQGNQAGTLVVVLADERTITIKGVPQAGSGSTRLQIRAVGPIAAAGTLTLSFANGDVNAVTGSGLIDRQRFSIDFFRTNSNPAALGRNATQESLTLLQTGTGLYNLAGQSFPIKRASVEVRGRQADLSFRLTDDRLVQLRGEVINRAPYSLVIRLTNSGDADASGTATVSHGEGKAISSIVIDGAVDGQDLLVDFSRQ